MLQYSVTAISVTSQLLPTGSADQTWLADCFSPHFTYMAGFSSFAAASGLWAAEPVAEVLQVLPQAAHY